MTPCETRAALRRRTARRDMITGAGLIAATIAVALCAAYSWLA